MRDVLTDRYTLHCGDCVDILRTMPGNSVDLIATDPPYPGLKGGTKMPKGGGVAAVINDSISIGTPWDTSLDWMMEAWRVCRLGMLVFCSYHSIADVRMQIPDAMTAYLITWYKRNQPPPINNVPWFRTEFVWCFKKRPGLKWSNLGTLIDIPTLPGGCFGTERLKREDGKTLHPTQKPVALMKTLLSVGGDTVLDPFAGTFTTGIACLETGRQFIGIEKDTGYFESGARRMAQHSMQPVLLEAAD